MSNETIHAFGPNGSLSRGAEIALTPLLGLPGRLDGIESQHLYGQDTPEGQASAKPGTYYTDVAGTNGAWLWVKVSGTGNTGWKIVHGDTGERQVSSLLVNGWTNISTGTWGAFLRRTGSRVQLRMYLQRSGATGVRTLVLPTGFRPTGTAYGTYAAANTTGATQPVTVSPTTGAVDVPYYQGTTSNGYVNVDFTTDQTWPATLPGSSI